MNRRSNLANHRSVRAHSGPLPAGKMLANKRHGYCGLCASIVQPHTGVVMQKGQTWRIFHLTCAADEKGERKKGAHREWLSPRTQGTLEQLASDSDSGELARRRAARAKILRDGGTIGRGDVG